MATTTNYYGLSKPSYNEVADIEVINANMDKIDTQMKNNSDGVNFAKGISSDAYDNSRPYAVGDYCIYDNKLYRCITAIESAEAFNVKKWEQTTVGNEVNQLNINLSNVNKNVSDLKKNNSTTVFSQATLGSYMASGDIQYYVRNGICFVTMEITPSKTGAGEGHAQGSIGTGLPKARYNQKLALGNHLGKCYTAVLLTNGELGFYFNDNSEIGRIDDSFSYPIEDY